MSMSPEDQRIAELEAAIMAFFDARDRQPSDKDASTTRRLGEFYRRQERDYQAANWQLRQAVYGPSGFPSKAGQP